MLSTPVSEFFQEVPNWVQFWQVVHIFGIAGLLSAALLIDLRVLGVVRKDRPTALVIDRFARTSWVSLLVLVVSGVLLLSVETRGIATFQFQYKVVALITAAVVTLTLERKMRAEGGDWDAAGGAPGGAKALAVASMVLWFTIAAAGRWIGYA